MAARDILIRENWKLAEKIAALIKKERTDVSEETEKDMVQEGLIAILKAAETYDAAREAGFETYASTVMENAIRDYLRKQTAAFDMRMSTISLSDVKTEENRQHYIDTASNIYTKDPADICVRKELFLAIYRAIGNVTRRGQVYLLYRYGFVDDMGHSLAETADHFMLSVSRVERTEKKVIEQLREVFEYGV